MFQEQGHSMGREHFVLLDQLFGTFPESLLNAHYLNLHFNCFDVYFCVHCVVLPCRSFYITLHSNYLEWPK